MLEFLSDFLFYAVIGWIFCFVVLETVSFVVGYVFGYLIASAFINTIFILWFVVELAFYEIRACWWRRYRRRLNTLESPWPKWSAVAQFVWSDAASRDKFFAVILCDIDPIDDPMHPHVSLIHVVEIRKRNSFWFTVTIWRISTLTSLRTKICEFHDFGYYVCFDHCHATAFQSRGVIFILFQHHREHCPTMLLVFDTRFNVKAEYRWGSFPICLVNPIVILCLGRRMRNAESIDGWRMRFLNLRREDYQATTNWFMYDRICDLRVQNDAFETVHSDIYILPRRLQRMNRIVRSPKKFGFFFKVGAIREKTFVYNIGTNALEAYGTLAEFFESEAPLRRHRQAVYESSLPRSNCPLVITDRESIVLGNGGIFYRTIFTAPTMRMATTRYIFREHPPMKKMTRRQFFESYGVDLPGHLV